MEGTNQPVIPQQISLLDLPADAIIYYDNNKKTYIREDRLLAHFPTIDPIALGRLVRGPQNHRCVDATDVANMPNNLWPNCDTSRVFNEICSHPRFSAPCDDRPGIAIFQNSKDIHSTTARVFVVLFRDNNDYRQILYRQRNEITEQAGMSYFHNNSFQEVQQRMGAAITYLANHRYYPGQIQLNLFPGEAQVYVTNCFDGFPLRKVVTMVYDALQ